MRDTGSPGPTGDEDQYRSDGAFLGDDVDDYDEPGFDWVVFLLRASALITFGATLITAIDLSRNQAVEWQTVMRLSILPFVGGMLLLAAAELIDRRGD